MSFQDIFEVTTTQTLNMKGWQSLGGVKPAIIRARYSGFCHLKNSKTPSQFFVPFIRACREIVRASGSSRAGLTCLQLRQNFASFLERIKLLLPSKNERNSVAYDLVCDIYALKYRSFTKKWRQLLPIFASGRRKYHASSRAQKGMNMPLIHIRIHTSWNYSYCA
jgi:hypothetical protein